MYSVVPVYLLTLSIFLLPAAGQVETTTKFSLKSKLPVIHKPCTTRNNQSGICVHKSNCNDNHEIEHGGRISEGELRTGSDCNINKLEWCCSEKNITNNAITGITETVLPEVTTVTANKVKKCIASDKSNYPSIVKLYRSFQNYAYCLGAIIGSNTILTTATCVLQARKLPIWAHVPSSKYPEFNYTVTSRLSHPKFNSGTRLNDIALLTTLNPVQWSSGGQEGACIDPKQSLNGECVAASLNEYDDINMVDLFVTAGSCSTGGNVSDAMCGNGLNLEGLIAGAPIMCPKNNLYILTGITKTLFPSGTALLGNFDYTWLVNTLKGGMGLNDVDFLYKLNY